MKAPVIDVGGTHVTAALVDTGRWRTVDGTRQRTPLRSEGTAVEIVATLVTAIKPLGDERLISHGRRERRAGNARQLRRMITPVPGWLAARRG